MYLLKAMTIYLKKSLFVIKRAALILLLIVAMEEEISKLKQEVFNLKQEYTLSKFTLSNFTDKISFYTGFPSYESLMACYKFLGPTVNNLKYWNSKVEEGACASKKRGRS